jgi:hypothetical protein
MSGRTDFNAELFGAEHLAIEDEKPATDWPSRRAFGTALKNFLTSQTGLWCHPKHGTPIILSPVQRLSISVNDDGEALQVLPSMDGDIADKVILLLVASRPMPMPTGTETEKAAFRNVLRKELPAVLCYIDKVWQPPAWLTAGEEAQRYGIISYKHPDLLEVLGELTPEMVVFDWINRVWFSGPAGTTFEDSKLSAHEIERRIRTVLADDCKWEIDRVLKGQNSMSTYLSRLARRFPDRIKRAKAHGGLRRWVLVAPPKSTLSNPPL